MEIRGYRKRGPAHSGGNGGDPFQDPFFARVGYFREQLLNKEALMEYLSILAAKTIRKAGWKTEDFELNNMYAILFMGGDMEQLMRSFDAEYSLVYQCVSKEQILCVCAGASMNENEEIEAGTQIYELSDYQKGNREWLELKLRADGKLSGEVESVGTDYFELEFLLKNADEEWIAAAEQGLIDVQGSDDPEETFI